MDVASSTAPPVVAVTVVHEPADHLTEVLRGLAVQDYPNLRTLFLLVEADDEVKRRILEVLPEAIVRTVGGNPGYGAVANGVLKLVEGSGFFCLLHDDVVLDPDAVSRLVEEIYRSNAGIVGPKLVEWDQPRVLQAVGFGVDRFGEIDPGIEPGELDQEQHDAVRDVFALPSACLVVRADLFRALGGFDPTSAFHADSLDLCWRAHLSGARVLVVPAARARHVGRLGERRPDLPHRRLSAVHRIRTVATLTGRWRTPLVLLQLVFVSLVEIVLGVFNGRARDGLASLYALGRLVPAFPAVLARRRHVRPLRQVPDREVAGLQLRGSARVAGFVRQRQRLQRLRQQAETGEVHRFERPDRLPGIVGLVLVVVFLIGSRALITGGVPRVGQFVDLPGPREAFRAYAAGWRTQGFGAAAAAPPALAVAGLAGALAGGAMGLARTWLVLGPILLGYLGMWRAMAFVPSVRARLGAVLVYAAVPLPYAAVSAGRWSVLATYGALPWAFGLLRRAAGLTALRGREWGDDDIAEAVTDVPTGELLRTVALLGLLGAVTGAFSPTFPILIVAVAVALMIGTVVAGGSRSVLSSVLASLVALAVAFVLLAPWSFDLLRAGAWDDIVGPAPASPRSLGLLELATFGIGSVPAGVLALGFFVPVVAGPLVTRGWRLTWSARAVALVAVFGVLAVLDDRGALPVRLPEPGLVLAPVALGVALAAGIALAGFEHDIRGARFGWRQPLGLLVSVALLAGLAHGVVAAAGGRWSSPKLTLADYLSQLPPATGLDGTPTGDYRILYVGDPRLLPLPGNRIADGLAYAVTDDGPVGLADQFPAGTNDGDELTAEALQAASVESTDRVGRLLAPLAVRYVVIPVDDGVRVGGDDPPAVPGGLVDALSRQLDLRLVDSPSQLVIYENTAWLPIVSVLDERAAAASTEAGASALAATSVGSGRPVLVGADLQRPVTGEVPAGPLALALPDDGQWQVTQGGTEVPLRPAFGWSVVADVPATGEVTIRRSQGSRAPWIVLEALFAVVLAVVGSGLRVRLGSRRAVVVFDGDGGPLAPVLDLDDTGGPEPSPRPASDRPVSPASADAPAAEPAAAPGRAADVPSDEAEPEPVGDLEPADDAWLHEPIEDER